MVAEAKGYPGPHPASLVHFILSVMYPLMKGAIYGMIFG
jgi:hypothetical protein